MADRVQVMCGIIAYTGSQQVLPVLIDGLRRLEYRGYDSAGIAFHSRKKVRSYKAAGKISVLESRLPESVSAHCGIGHTRWATHGACLLYTSPSPRDRG